MRATADIKKGDKVCLSYRTSVSNMDSFLIHGFVMEPNEVYETQITIDLSADFKDPGF